MHGKLPGDVNVDDIERDFTDTKCRCFQFFRQIAEYLISQEIGLDWSENNLIPDEVFGAEPDSADDTEVPAISRLDSLKAKFAKRRETEQDQTELVMARHHGSPTTTTTPKIDYAVVKQDQRLMRR